MREKKYWFVIRKAGDGLIEGHIEGIIERDGVWERDIRFRTEPLPLTSYVLDEIKGWLRFNGIPEEDIQGLNDLD